MIDEISGTHGYIAPEVYLKPHEGDKSDIFALGVCLFIMYSCSIPFNKAKSSDRVFKIFSCKKKKYWKI